MRFQIKICNNCTLTFIHVAILIILNPKLQKILECENDKRRDKKFVSSALNVCISTIFVDFNYKDVILDKNCE